MIVSFIITVLVTAVSLIIISRLNIGIGVSDLQQALLAGLVIGLINAFVYPMTAFTFGIVPLILNALLFWLAAFLIKGFALRHGFWSALLGSFLLTVINTVLFYVLRLIGLG